MGLSSWALLLSTAVGASACAGGGEDGYPVRPGTGVGGGPGGGTADAGVDGRLDGGITTGRICLASSLRTPDVCAATGAAGISVTRGTFTVLTGADGTFLLPPATAVGNWSVSGAGLVTMVAPYLAGAAVQIPVFTTAAWDLLRRDNNMVLVDGQGSVMVSALRPSALYKPLVVVSTDPAGVSGVYYAGDGLQIWNRDATSALGVAVAPGLPAGTITLAGVAPDASRTLPQVPVVAGAITFVRLDFAK